MQLCIRIILYFSCYFQIGNHIFDSKLNVVRELEPAPDIVDDADNIIQLCIETINGGHGTLIFCPTKIWCEKLALQMSKMFFKLGIENLINLEKFHIKLYVNY